MMPDFDGLSLCTKIRNNPNTSHIPIVLLTAKTDESDNLDGLDHGADAYITKPFSIELLLKTIERTIKNRDIIKNGEYEQTLQKEHISTVSIKSPDEKLLAKVYLLIENNLDNQSLRYVLFAKRSEEHTSELKSLLCISYAVFCLKNKIQHKQI